MNTPIRSLNAVGASLALGIGMLTTFATPAHAQEFGDNTPYYEDDGLLDITEWFDGNDYNPTDEAWWRWDDETYQAWKDTGGDTDGDWYYGYSTRNDDDWFYDYYDPWVFSYNDPNNDNLYDYGYRYYDYDNDGITDAYASYSDWDGDGFYEDYDYYSFTDTSDSTQKESAEKELNKAESRSHKLTGTIDKTKEVQVRGGAKHTIVAIKPQSGAQSTPVIADLGKTDKIRSVNLKVGDSITVNGPKAMVGKQGVLLANSFDFNGRTTQIDRSTRSITGKVLDTHKTTVRSKEHQMAMVEVTRDGKTQKVAVDLGPVDKLGMTPTKDSRITFSGFPVKVKDKMLIIAQTVQKDGKAMQINRQPAKTAEMSKPGSRDN